MDGSCPIRCVVFDFDGVLVDSNAVKQGAYFGILIPFGAPGGMVETVLAESEEGDRFIIIGRVVGRLRAAGLLPTGVSIEGIIQGLAEQYNRICEEHAATCKEILGVSASLAKLTRRYALYVNSATPEEPLRRIVDRRGWRGYFRDVLGRPRTKTENLRLIIAREVVEPSAVVVVGDGLGDLEAAKQCGCRFVGVSSHDEDFRDTDALVLGDLSRLDDVICQM